MSSTVAIEINAKPFQVSSHATIIEAADKLGIYIPRFCYHKKLSIAANCRMCLVEVEKSGKPLPACATPVSPGMRVWTRSDKAKSAQSAVMEFLLINHPLDCPICDQGGQCELQDLAMRYGRDNSAFTESKRAVPDDDLGPLIATEMTRCIHCTRCVRFGTEIAGIKELGAACRGEHMQITTYVQHSLRSELSGNIIDLCPVGALTSKPFQFKARAWELRQMPSIAPHDCLGSHVFVHYYQGQVLRVIPRENEAINETWLSDRDRYSYLGLASSQRLTQPMIRVGDQWQETDWPIALDQATRCLQKALKSHGSLQLGALISPSASLEEMYCLQDLCRLLGSPHIDHRLREVDIRDQTLFPLYPKSEITLDQLGQCDVIVLIGSNPQREQPVLAQRLRKAVERGTQIISINCLDYEVIFETTEKVIIPPDQLLGYLTTLVQRSSGLHNNIALDSSLNPSISQIAGRLQTTNRIALVVGAMVYQHPQAANLRYWIGQWANQTGAAELHLTEGANTAGAWIAGAIPHRVAGGGAASEIGLSAQAMLEAQLKAFLLVKVDPILESYHSQQAREALFAAECVIALSSFKSESLLETADVLLPITSFAETAGTLVNVEGKWQRFQAIVPPLGLARPGWDILQELSHRLVISAKSYNNIEAVHDTVQNALIETQFCPTTASAVLPVIPFPDLKADGLAKRSLMRITEWPLYSTDALVRHAEALQKSASHEPTGIYIHPHQAKVLQLAQGQLVRVQQEGQIAILPVQVDSKVPMRNAWIPAGRPETATLGEPFGHIQILNLDK